MHRIKTGDARTLRWELNADLSLATLNLVAKEPDGTHWRQPATCESVKWGNSTVAVRFDTSRTATSRTLQVEIEAVAGGDTVTFPDEGFLEVLVSPDAD